MSDSEHRVPHGVVSHRSPVRFWLGLLALWLTICAIVAVWLGIWHLAILAPLAAYSARLIGYAIDGATPVEVLLLQNRRRKRLSKKQAVSRPKRNSLPATTRKKIRLRR